MTPAQNTNFSTPLQNFGIKNKDIAFALGVVLVLTVLFVPLPAILLDFGLALSLALSVLILMVALWIPRPLDFNSFPTLLLVVTMLRLSLNIASTRLILSSGHTGTDAAGSVIEGFSWFLVGGDYVIGAVVFIILAIINFMVVTKGATRIAEVSARFTLDSIPGKQMSIDADLGTGAITDEEAKERREDLNNESSFFGAMDGASKFVRGDAIAGIIITLINVVGGIIIGLLSHDMTIADAASNYTVLTIGDGLVTQIPALVVSLAAGMIVTKGSTKGAANEAVLSQLGGYPKAMFMAAALLTIIGLMPGFPFFVFASIAAAMAGGGYLIDRRAKDAKAREEAANEEDAYNTAYAEETPQELLKVDDLRLELGAGLVNLISSMDAALPGKVRKLRNLFAEEYGFILPFVRIKDEVSLPANEYKIRVRNVVVASGDIRPNAALVIDPQNQPIELSGEKTKEPAFGLSACWIDPARTDEAERLGYTVVDPESVVVTHLTEVIKESMPDLMSYKSTKELVAGLDRDYQKLLADTNQSGDSTQTLQNVLQSLLAEKVSIRNLPLIIEAIAEGLSHVTNQDDLVEIVRTKLGTQICEALTHEDGWLHVLQLSAEWENEMITNQKMIGDRLEWGLSPERNQAFLLDARKSIQKFAHKEEWPPILVDPRLRRQIKLMLDRVSPTTQVISHGELPRKLLVKTVDVISSE